MAYSGATAASSVANPPRLLARGQMTGPVNSTGLTTAGNSPGNQGGGLWFYASTNLTTDLTSTGFFSDGFYLGMRPGDMVMGVQFSSAGSSVTTFMGGITAVSTDGANFSTGSLVTSTFS